MPDPTREDEEGRVIRALRRLEERWPEHLFLFANSGVLELRRITEDGPQMDEEPLEVFPRIECDGGDW